MSGILEFLKARIASRPPIIICIVVLWLVSIWWAAMDSRRRGKSGFFGGTLAACLPVVGIVIWMLVRPAEGARWRRST